jgi:hypothetical protein
MRIAGDVNWYLPNWLARILRVEPSAIRRS